jgi:tetratricopeptide (TPR) repeat protein
MTNESFAEHIHVAVRTVAYWRQRPDTVPQSGIQALLDQALENAPEQVQAKFVLLLEGDGVERNPLDVNYSSELDPDEQARIRGVIHAPSRLDAVTVTNLTRALYAQRHAEDSLGSRVMIAPMTAELDTYSRLLREARGPHRVELMRLVANWTTFIGWCHTALREYPEADARFASAEEMADEIGDGQLASTGTSYRGYIALLQGHHRAAVRATAAALATPGAHPVQLAYDTLQAGQAYAGLGDLRGAKNLLRRASDLVTNAGDPPESLYWYTEPFLRMNIGLTQYAIGQHRDAVDSLSSGMAELPADQQNAEWLEEYQQALDYATGQTDAPEDTPAQATDRHT